MQTDAPLELFALVGLSYCYLPDNPYLCHIITNE